MENVQTGPLVPDSQKELRSGKRFKFPVLNRVAVAGSLIHDPPIRWTKRGVPVTNFIIATEPEKVINAPEGMDRESCYVSVVVWSKQALQCNKFLKKGSSVLILGELQSMPNNEPENEYYPIQLSAQWIQYLEKDAIHNITDFMDEDTEMFHPDDVEE
ncbi:single-stranded DNA-binding protein [candidate division KSB1 bacterium]|nr:single-stranded DNA-binding protein [candidate division KSB1 bacterium]